MIFLDRKPVGSICCITLLNQKEKYVLLRRKICVLSSQWYLYSARIWLGAILAQRLLMTESKNLYRLNNFLGKEYNVIWHSFSENLEVQKCNHLRWIVKSSNFWWQRVQQGQVPEGVYSFLSEMVLREDISGLVVRLKCKLI